MLRTRLVASLLHGHAVMLKMQSTNLSIMLGEAQLLSRNRRTNSCCMHCRKSHLHNSFLMHNTSWGQSTMARPHHTTPLIFHSQV